MCSKKHVRALYDLKQLGTYFFVGVPIVMVLAWLASFPIHDLAIEAYQLFNK